MKFHLAHADSVARVTEVLEAIGFSDDWPRISQVLESSDWLGSRNVVRRFFDVYEGQAGTGWLGIMEWAVVEEIRSQASALAVDPRTIDRVVARISRHPDIEMLR